MILYGLCFALYLGHNRLLLFVTVYLDVQEIFEFNNKIDDENRLEKVT